MFASYPLSHLLHKYKDQGFGINYFEKNRSDITSLLVSKEVEIGLMTMFSIDKENWLSAFKSQGIEYSPLILQGPFIAVGPPSEFYDDQWTCVTPEVLANHKMMVFSETREPFSSIERKLVKVFNPSGSLTVSDRGSQLSLLHQTDSYLVCAYNANAYRTATFYKDIKCLPITGTDISCEIGYVKLRDRSLSAVAQEYLQMITDMLK